MAKVNVGMFNDLTSNTLDALVIFKLLDYTSFLSTNLITPHLLEGKMVLGEFLPDVDTAAAYLRQNLNQFPLRRLEQILHEEIPSEAFQIGLVEVIQVNGEKNYPAISTYVQQFMDTVLRPFTDLCGMQLEEKPETDMCVYHVFGNFWGSGKRYEFKTAIEILKNGLNYHADSAQLYVDIGYNYFLVAQGAVSQENWNAVLANAAMGRTYLDSGLELNAEYNPVLVAKLKKSHDTFVAKAEMELREKGKR